MRDDTKPRSGHCEKLDDNAVERVKAGSGTADLAKLYPRGLTSKPTWAQLCIPRNDGSRLGRIITLEALP